MIMTLNLSIQSKLIVGFSCLFIFSMTLLSHNHYKLQIFSQRIDLITKLREPTQRISNQLEDGVKRTNTLLTSWILTRNEHYNQQRQLTWQNDILPAIQQLDTLAAKSTKNDNVRGLDKIKSLLIKLQSIQSKITEQKLTRNEIIKLVHDQQKPIIEKVTYIMNDMTRSQEFMLKEDVDHIQNAIKDHLKQQLFWLFITFVLAVAIVILIINDVRKSILDLKKTARKLAKSTLKPKIRTNTSNELDSVGHAMETMAQQLYEARETEKHVVKKEAELTLRECYAKEQTEIYDAILYAIIIINEDGQILSFNPSAETLFGYQSDEVIGQNVKLLMPQSYAVHHDKFLFSYITTGKANIIGIGREVEGQTKDNDVFPMQLSIVEISQEENGKRRFLGSCHDLTTINLQNKKLRSAQKMEALGKLTGGISHDYNNILGVITGYTELLLLHLQNQPKLVKHLEGIIYASQRGAKLTKKLLGFSQYKSPSSKPENINTLLTAEKLILERTLTTRIILLLDLSDDLWTTKLDKSAFEDSVLNLCINSMHAIKGTGTLYISTCNRTFNDKDCQENQQIDELGPGEYVVLRVTDTGIGINETDMEKVFDPFFSTKGSEGTGLGLSMVYGFVKSCNGMINVQSHVEKGTQFTLYFPRSLQEDTNEDETSDNLTDNRPPKSSEVILVVDDEAALTTILYEYLTSKGYQVFSALNAQEAMDILEKESIDLMITDAIMPKMDGHQLATFTQQTYPSTRIIMASGYVGSDVSNNKQTFTYPIVTKPYQLKAILKMIRDMCDEKPSH